MIRKYKNVRSFLDEVEPVLVQNELENSFILGLCNTLPNKEVEVPDHHFLSVFSQEGILATSIKLNQKAIVSEGTGGEHAMKLFAEYYQNAHVDLSGAIGPLQLAESFASLLQKSISAKATLHMLRLSGRIDSPPSDGEFVIADEGDVVLLIEWIRQFYSERMGSAKKNSEKLDSITRSLITQKSLFYWRKNNRIVSMAAIIHKTKNFSIVGFVFTPVHERAKGYSRCCLQALNNRIAQSGSNCALYVDEENIVALTFFKKLGFQKDCEIIDLDFE